MQTVDIYSIKNQYYGNRYILYFNSEDKIDGGRVYEWQYPEDETGERDLNSEIDYCLYYLYDLDDDDLEGIKIHDQHSELRCERATVEFMDNSNYNSCSTRIEQLLDFVNNHTHNR